MWEAEYFIAYFELLYGLSNDICDKDTLTVVERDVC